MGNNLYVYIENLSLLEKLFFDFNFLKDEVEIINIVPLTISLIFILFFLSRKKFGYVVIFVLSLSAVFYSYLNNIKDDLYNKVKQDKIYLCSQINKGYSYLSEEKMICLRSKLTNEELKNNKLNFLEETFILNKDEIFKDLKKDIEYNKILIIIVIIIVVIISRKILIGLFGEYKKEENTMIDGTETNPLDYPYFAIMATILYVLSQLFLNSTNINIKRVNYKILEKYKDQRDDVIEKKEVVTKEPTEFLILKDIIKDKYKYDRITNGKFDDIQLLKIEDVNIDKLKEFLKNKDNSNNYFDNLFKNGFYENKNLALENRDKLSFEYQKKANNFLINEVKNNKAELIKNNLGFFGFYSNGGYNSLIKNNKISDMETNIYLSSVTYYKNNVCESINYTIDNGLHFTKKTLTNKEIKEIINISEKYNCYNQYRTLKIK